jgi:prepilin-type N-terminal cleavage/methylation domain-containing protein
MKTRKYKNGLSLIEMLVVVAVIAVLATMVIGVATHIDTQAKEKGIESVLTLLEGALQEYHEFTGSFPEQLEKNFVNAAAHSEYLYQELSSIPNSRKILETINNSLIENKYGTAQTPPEIHDPWGTALDYRYVRAIDNFPELISAGPDRNFNTADDISNR